jgi:hypothetical protein
MGRRISAALVAATALSSSLALAQQVPSLEAQFRDPPASARPRVWWHWINGNVTKEGIARDLAWMKRVGIGGLQNFDVDFRIPQIVDQRLPYMSPGWKDAFRFAASEADRLGLELAISSSSGWSISGGPWVPAQDGMKKLVWSEVELSGGKRFNGKLPAPPDTIGPYQSIDLSAVIQPVLTAPKPPPPAPYYADVAVLAVRLPDGQPMAKASASDGEGRALDAATLSDTDLKSGVDLAKAERPASLQIAYPAAQTVRAATLYVPMASAIFAGPNMQPRIEASDDGVIWRKVADIPLGAIPTTVAFEPVTASRFRVTFRPETGAPSYKFNAAVEGVDMAALNARNPTPPRPPLRVTDFRLFSNDRIDRIEAKAGFAVVTNYYALDARLPETRAAAPDDVIDLTSKMRADGTLDWTPPSGRWRVLRLGSSLIGAMNHPGTAEATGLEIDKLDAGATRRYFEHYIGLYKEAAGPDLVGDRGVRAMLTDSIESGPANWTPRMIEQFRRLRGYDPTPWLPTLTGMVIGSRAQSEKFLYDYRRTLTELVASEHYRTAAQVAHENRLRLYGEALESGRPMLGDDLAMRRYADIPMAAQWTFPRDGAARHVPDIKGAASIAHIYGQNLVAAESLSASMAPWAFGPDDLKRVIDQAFVRGVNLPVIHTSVHVPVEDKKPGLSLAIWGQFFNRNESWAELARPWVDYVARNSLMLQQGRNFADIAYFAGEEGPLTALGQGISDTPTHYAYDFVNVDVLMGALANDGGELVTPGGARYRVLYLGGSSRRMTLPTLRRIAALAEGGALVIGQKPVADPSLADDAAAFEALTARLWPAGGDAQIGKGRVVASGDVESALAQGGIAADFDFAGAQPNTEIPFLHRRLADGDSYFLVNPKSHPETIEARFRVTGKAPELWHAETGTSEPVSYRIENGVTIVPLTLDPEESVHVVFRKAAPAPAFAIKKVTGAEVGRVDQPWHVTFEPGRGAPPSATFTSLAPLDENTDLGIRYFSGIAAYSSSFTTPRGWRPGQPLWIDLGEAREIAEVSVNGTFAGYAWHAPYRVDVSKVAKPGRNSLQVRVANLWVNRLIGDKQPGAAKVGWTVFPNYTADAPLRRSGLIGPVRLMGIATAAK